jgi:para-nitrobenzyl esterase
LSLQLLQAGLAQDAAAARAAQLLMTDTEVRDFMYSRSTRQILGGLTGAAGMYRAPQAFRDGTVLPEDTLYQVFSDPRRYNSVPLIIGTNRDEMKLFLAQNPDFVERRFGILPRIKDKTAFNSTAAYLSDSWKALAVDGVANIIAATSEQPVFAYRWDWDEGSNNLLVDYSELLGASHGLEVSYIFNSFDDGIIVPGLYNSENTGGRDLLAAQMRSYWSEFARNGTPARGRNGVLPMWTPWSAEGPNLMLLDTARDGGLRMVREPMTVTMLRQRLAEDQNMPDLRARCAMYVQLFLLPNAGDDVWDATAYADMGCAEFPPWSLEDGR